MAELDCNKTSVFVSCAVISLFFSSDILKKFNPKIKGVSKGQGKWQTGFNMAVSGAKISLVLAFLQTVISFANGRLLLYVLTILCTHENL